MCNLHQLFVFVCVFKCVLCVLLIKSCDISLSPSLSLSVVTLCRATVIYFLEGAIAVLAAELPWRSASVFHKVSVKVEGALHNRSAPSHSRLKILKNIRINTFFLINCFKFSIADLIEHIYRCCLSHISPTCIQPGNYETACFVSLHHLKGTFYVHCLTYF